MKIFYPIFSVLNANAKNVALPTDYQIVRHSHFPYYFAFRLDGNSECPK